MSNIFVCGVGAVSPAGWGMKAFREALARGAGIPTKELARPGHTPLPVRQVPPSSPRPAFLAHARLRRTSPIAHYAVSAALEALGEDATRVTSGALRLGVIYCVLTGCVNYSRRFYDEVLKDPSTASPLVFPETVYNSPASHLAALIGTTGINYTLVGDPGTLIQGLVLAADWLTDNRVDGCLVIGAEEMDWSTAGAIHLFERKTIFSDGAGALYLRRGNSLKPLISIETENQSAPSISVPLSSPKGGEGRGEEALRVQGEAGQNAIAQLRTVTNAHLFTNHTRRAEAIKRAREQLEQAAGTAALPGRTLLCDSLQGVPRADRDEQAAWSNWTGARASVKTILGEALMASAAWQCVAAVDALTRNEYDAANVSVAGTNQQAIAAQFTRCSDGL